MSRHDAEFLGGPLDGLRFCTKRITERPRKVGKRTVWVGETPPEGVTLKGHYHLTDQKTSDGQRWIYRDGGLITGNSNAGQAARVEGQSGPAAP